MTDAIRSELEEYVDAQQAAQEERASDCVSEKISEYIKKGHKQDQAIAIAYSECEGRTLSEDEIARVAPLYADAIERACATTPDEEQKRSIVGQSVVTYRFVNRAASIDTLEGVVNGYVYIYGDPEHRDAYGTYFDPARPVDLDIENGAFRRPIKYEHCQDPIIGLDTVGYIETVQPDAVGLRFEGRLDRSSPHYERIVGELQRGELFTSSATGEHTAKFRDDGSFESWTLLELSLTRYPAESRMPGVTLIRSATPEEAHAEPRAGDEANAPAAQPLPVETESVGEKQMTPEQLAMLQQLVAEFGADAVEAAIEQAAAPQPEAAPAPVVEVVMSAAPAADARSIFANLRAALEANKKNADVEALRSRITALEAERNAPPAAQPIVRGASRPGEGVNVNAVVQEAKKYARFSHSEMFTLAEIMRSANMPMSEGFARALAHRGLDFAQNDKSGSPVIAAYRSAFKRADDFMATDIAGQGTEWVGTFYGDQVWEKARHQPIMDALRAKNLMEIEVPDGASNAVVPLESSDPTFFTTAQANDLDGSGSPETVVNVGYVGTSSVTVTPGQLTGAVGYTDILSEDAVIAQGLVTQLNAQLNQAAIRLPEYVLINGDTTRTASTNINAIDGTPGTGINSPAYLVSDGALKLALVTNSAQSRDGGTLDDADFLANMNLMDSDTLADPDRMVHIVDPITYQKALAMLAIKTRDVAGVDASLFNGRVPPVYGVDVLRTGQMALANSAGKIPAAGGTLGRILTMYAPYWAMVWKRRINFETARIALAQSNVIIVSMRIGFRARHATLSSSKAAAVSYNLTV